MLTIERKRQMRAIGHHLKPIVWISERGLSPSLLGELNRALADHELIKIKGIGQSLCNTVQQILMTHTCDKYDIIMGCDNSLEIFTKIHGVGVKKQKN